MAYFICSFSLPKFLRANKRAEPLLFYNYYWNELKRKSKSGCATECITYCILTVKKTTKSDLRCGNLGGIFQGIKMNFISKVNKNKNVGSMILSITK